MDVGGPNSLWLMPPPGQMRWSRGCIKGKRRSHWEQARKLRSSVLELLPPDPCSASVLASASLSDGPNHFLPSHFWSVVHHSNRSKISRVYNPLYIKIFLKLKCNYIIFLLLFPLAPPSSSVSSALSNGWSLLPQLLLLHIYANIPTNI